VLKITLSVMLRKLKEEIQLKHPPSLRDTPFYGRGNFSYYSPLVKGDQGGLSPVVFPLGEGGLRGIVSNNFPLSKGGLRGIVSNNFPFLIEIHDVKKDREI